MNFKKYMIAFSIVRLILFSILIGISSQVYKQHWCDDSTNYKTMIFAIVGLVGIIIFFVLMVIESDADYIKKGIHIMAVIANILFYLILSIQSLKCAPLDSIFIIYAIAELVLLIPQLKQIQTVHEQKKFMIIALYLVLIDIRIIFNNYYQKSVGPSHIANTLLVFIILLACLKLIIMTIINEESLDILLYITYAVSLSCSIFPFFFIQKPSDIVFSGISALFFLVLDWGFTHFVLQEEHIDRELEIYYIINQVIGFVGIIFYSLDGFSNHSLQVCGSLFAAITLVSSHILPNIKIDKQLQQEVAFFVSIVNILFAITLGCMTINGTAYFIDNIAYSAAYGIYTLIFTLFVSNKIIERNQDPQDESQDLNKKQEFSLY